MLELKLGFISQLRVLLHHLTASFELKELGSALVICEIIELKRLWPSKSFLLPTCNYCSSLNSELKCLVVSSSLFNEKMSKSPLGRVLPFMNIFCNK